MTSQDPEERKLTHAPEGADPSNNGQPQTPGATAYERDQLKRLKTEEEMSEGKDYPLKVGPVWVRTPNDGAVD